MLKALRLSEKWFHRLWLVSLVFASFPDWAGGTVVGDLPKVETPLQLDDFLDQEAAKALRGQVKAAQQAEQDAWGRVGTGTAATQQGPWRGTNHPRELATLAGHAQRHAASNARPRSADTHLLLLIYSNKPNAKRSGP